MMMIGESLDHPLVQRCARGRAHDWTECPYAHPGEKARRRDPRKYHYSGTPCEELRKGSCRKGDSCEFAHGVFECWLHPTRYRTQLCKDGPDCRRRVCFFAHSPEQLRILNQHSLQTELFVNCSPSSVRKGLNESLGSSPTSILAFPPLSPFSGFSCSSPNRSGLSACEYWTMKCEAEEPEMDRVESGRNLRVKMYAKLKKENSLGRNESVRSFPDIDRVSELIK